MKHTPAYKNIWPLAIIGLSAIAHASDDVCFEKAQTQSQLTTCAADALKRQDQELNRLYQQMQSRLKGDDSAKRLLIAAQRQWIAFRDAECGFTAMRSTGSSMHAMEANLCLADLTRDRVNQLENHLACGKGADEQTALNCAVPRQP